MANIVPIQKDNLNSFGKEADIKALYKECWDFAYRNWSPFIQEATEDLAAYLGSQWDPQDRAFLKAQKRSALVFNKIRRVIKMVTGYERKSRHSLIAQPVEGSDELTADQLSEVMLWLMNSAEMGSVMSEAFEQALKTGINLVSLGIDFNEDPVNGDLKLFRIPYNAFLLDPRFTKRDLSDCDFILQRRQVSREGAKALLPFRADDIEDLPQKDGDDRFPFMQKFSDTRTKEVMSYDEFWVRKFKDVKMLVDQQTGQTIEIDKKDVKDERLNFFLQQFPQVKVVNRSVPTVELNVLVNGHVMWSGDDPLGINDFPHTMVSAYWDPEFSDQSGHGDFSLKLQSLVRPMRDPQTEVNKRRSKMLDILDSQLNSGWIAKSDSVVNPADLYQSGQGKTVWLKKNATMADLQKIPSGDLGSGFFQLAQLLDQDVQDVSGATEELLGQPDNSSQISGETVKMRQGAALTIMQDLFDNLRGSQKQLGKKLIKAIQSNYGPEKIQRIINKEPAPSFYEKTIGKFDVVVEESIETPTQRALAYQQVLQATQAGILPQDIAQELALEYLPIQKKDEVRKKLQERLQKEAEQAQKLAEQEQLIKQLQQSKMVADVGLGVERLARAEANRGLAQERQSEFAQNHANAILARTKAIKEIENMEVDQLIRLSEYLKTLENERIVQGESQIKQNQVQTKQDYSFLTAQTMQGGQNATEER